MKALVTAFGVLAVAASGCGLSQLHTARPTPVGEVDVTLGLGRLDNPVVRDGDAELAKYPAQLAVRVGVGAQVDLGVRALLGDGALVDAQWGLLAPESPWALSVSAGLGIGGWLGQGSGVSLTLPVVVLGSWDPTPWLTPYLGVGWASWWHLGREVTEGDTSGDYVAQRGHGDGVVTLLGGLAFHVSAKVSLLVEYDFTTQVLDDPGDLYSMVDSHLVSLGVTF